MSRLGLDRTLNRLVHVGLWAIMKSPLLLSSDLPSLVPALIQMVNNTEVRILASIRFDFNSTNSINSSYL